jgi:hypothetical protein
MHSGPPDLTRSAALATLIELGLKARRQRTL